jgi:hypothetical protein
MKPELASNFTKCWKSKTMQTVKRSELSRSREGGGGTDTAQRVFRAVETLSDTVIVNTRHDTVVKTHRMHTSRVSPSVNCGLWVNFPKEAAFHLRGSPR